MKAVDLSKLKVDRDVIASPRKRRLKSPSLKPLVGVSLLVAAVLAWTFMPAAEVSVQVTRVVTAWPSQEFVTLDATGYVIARRKAAVNTKGTGRIESIGPTEGQFVKAGTVVARLDRREAVSTYEAAAANSDVAAAGVTNADTELSDAASNLQRVSTLYNKGLVAQMTLQEANSRLRRAEAAMSSATAGLAAARANQERARTAIDYSEIKAPFDGVVIARNANVGDIVTPMPVSTDLKSAVMVLADMSSLEVNADVSETALGKIYVGQPCEIALDAFPARRFRGVVELVIPAVNRASATVTTRIRILDRDSTILPDMSARVSFLNREVKAASDRPLLAVAPKAIARDGERAVVYKVGSDNHAQAVPVQVGARLGDVVAVKGKLSAGDVLVMSPGSDMADGVPLKLPEKN